MQTMLDRLDAYAKGKGQTINLVLPSVKLHILIRTPLVVPAFSVGVLR